MFYFNYFHYAKKSIMQKKKLSTHFSFNYKKVILKFIFAFTFLFYSNESRASKVYASSFGYNAVNATTAYQIAIQDAADTTIFDFVGNGDWNIDPVIFFYLNNKTIIFEPNVQLVARTGYTVQDCLLQFKQCNGVKIIGNNTILKMRKADYPPSDISYRHTLAIVECTNIEASNLRIEDSGADGIFIGSFSVVPGKEYSENIILRNIICNNGRRQGISVISAKNLLVEHCWFKNTIGELPEAGVDLEPDRPEDVLQNIEFRKCSFTGNNGSGISVSVQNLVASSVPMSIVFNDCYLQHNEASDVVNGTDAESEIYATGNATNFPTGSVIFNRCFVEESTWNAVRVRKAADGFSMAFNDCVFKDVASTAALSTNNYPIYPPIWIETTSYNPAPTAAFGGVAFNNLLLDFDANKPFIIANGSSTNAGLANLTGNITVINPTNLPPLYNTLASQSNVTYTYNFINNYPSTTTSIINFTNTFNETNCNKDFFVINRNAINKNYPIAIKHFLTGTAGNGPDYLYMPPFNILPSTVSSVQDSIVSLQDNFIEADEQVINTIIASNHYTANTSNTYTATLTNAACSGPLAVHFVYVKAYKLQQKHHIVFEVVEENLNSEYEIQYSTNGINFFTIVQLQGTMQGTYEYNYTPLINTQKIFYRVKIKENNIILFSSIVAITEAEKSYDIFPNPTRDFVTINDYRSVKIIKIINAQANIVAQIKPTSNKINLAELLSGVYYLKIVGMDNSTVIKKLIKL